MRSEFVGRRCVSAERNYPVLVPSILNFGIIGTHQHVIRVLSGFERFNIKLSEENDTRRRRLQF